MLLAGLVDLSRGEGGWGRGVRSKQARSNVGLPANHHNGSRPLDDDVDEACVCNFAPSLPSFLAFAYRMYLYIHKQTSFRALDAQQDWEVIAFRGLLI